MASAGKYEIDMCRGPLLGKMLLFVLPIFCTYALQTLFNAADMVIIGRFGSSEALAAIGATLNPITLFLKLAIGLSTGTNVVMAYHLGARNDLKSRQCVHTAMAMALYGGIGLMVAAILATRPILTLMNTPEDILRESCTYMRIYFLGLPFLISFNFGCAVLRAKGDSKRPLYFLLSAGLLNVLLNILFVIGFHLSVEGVALATTISNALAALLVLRVLILSPDVCHLNLHHLRMHADIAKAILVVGIPAAINSTFFNLANMFIQSAVNTFGTFAVAGNAACVSIESLVTISSTAFQQMVTPFTAQNAGARRYTRMVRCCVLGTVLSGGAGLLLGCTVCAFGEQALGFFNPDPQVISWGMARMKILMIPFFLGSTMDALTGCLRGIGHPVVPTVCSLFGACFFRIAWVFLVFPHWRSLEALFLCYPVSWFLVSAIAGAFLFVYLKKIFRDELHRDHLAMFP